MSEQPIVDAICLYVDEMCTLAVMDATGFYTGSTLIDLRGKARQNLNKQLRVLAERENQLAYVPEDPSGAELDTIDLHPMDLPTTPVRVRDTSNVDAAD